MKEYICCFCGKKFNDFGNNPFPANKEDDARCCNNCNLKIVIPTRIALLKNN